MGRRDTENDGRRIPLKLDRPFVREGRRRVTLVGNDSQETTVMAHWGWAVGEGAASKGTSSDKGREWRRIMTAGRAAAEQESFSPASCVRAEQFLLQLGMQSAPLLVGTCCFAELLRKHELRREWTQEHGHIQLLPFRSPMRLLLVESSPPPRVQCKGGQRVLGGSPVFSKHQFLREFQRVPKEKGFSLGEGLVFF
ncbi:unnamed protein product [Ectocarpus sp. 12 AP-2014]